MDSRKGTAFAACPVHSINGISSTFKPLEPLRTQRRPPFHRPFQSPQRAYLHPLPSGTRTAPTIPIVSSAAQRNDSESRHVEQIYTGELTQVLSSASRTSSTANVNIDESGDDGLEYQFEAGHPVLVLSFVTSNCRACMYAQTGFEKLAREFSEKRTHRSARFFEVDVSAKQNQKLGQQLGVTAVPSFQLFAYKDEDGAEDKVDVKQESSKGQAGRRGGAFGVLDELVGARVVGKVRDRLLHYCSDAFDMNEYVFDDDQ